MNKKDLQQKLAALVNEQRALLDKAEAEKRNFEATENEQYEKREKDILDLEVKIQEFDTQEKRIKAQAERESRMGTAQTSQGNPNAEERAINAMREYVRGGELRALQSDLSVSGGFLVMPMQTVDQLIKFVDNEVFIRPLATKFRVPQAESLGAPELTADPADAAWTAEIGSASEDSTMAFGRRELTPHKLTKLIKVSNKLLRQASIDPVSLVSQRFAYKFAVTEEQAFLTGTGAGQPLGVFTASNSGIPTSRDVNTGNSTTAIGADGLIEAKWACKAQYHKSGVWVFSRTAVKNIRKLKDGNGDYLLRVGGSLAGTQATILESPYFISEYAPSTFTTGLYVGIFGDFSNYWIADALNPEMQRLNELYAATDQTGFIMRQWVDGQPVLAEAFARVTLA